MTKTYQNRSLQQQVLRRAIPVLIAAFVVLGFIAVTLYQANVRLQLEREHESALNQRTYVIEQVVKKFVADIANLPKRGSVLAFTRATEDIVPGRAYTPAQLQLAREFLNALDENPGTYYGIQFVTVTGTVWTAVTDTNGIYSTDFRSSPNKLVNDDYFQASLTTKDTVVSPVLTRKNISGAVETYMRAVVPVVDTEANDELMGFIDFTLNLETILATTVNQSGEENWQLLLVDKNNHLLDSQTPLQNIDAGLAELLSANGDTIKTEILNNAIISTRILSNARLSDMPWTLILIDRNGVTAFSLFGGVLVIVLVTAAACWMSIVFLSRALRARLEPLAATRELASRLATGEAEATLPPTNGSDEVAQINASVSRMSQRLTQLDVAYSDQREHQKRRLEAASTISRILNSAHTLDYLLPPAVTTINEEFKLYHTQIYLLDDIGQHAVVMNGRGTVGKLLVEQGYKVLVGSATPVGVAAASGSPVLINDTLNPGDFPFIGNPLLPDTRALLVLPLQVDDQTIGILELHSGQTDFFSDEDVSILRLIAAQLAFAIQKLQQIGDYEKRLEVEDNLNRQAARNAWSGSEAPENLANSYHYDLMNVVPESHDDGEIAAISAPIIIRGEVIGTIAAAAQEGLPFSEGDHAILRAVADRVGLAIEGARLFQKTQSSLAVTSSLYQLSRQLNEATELGDIVEAVIKSVAADASSGQIWLFDDTAAGGTPTWMQLAAYWSDKDQTDFSNSDIRLRVSASPFMADLHHNKVKVISDRTRDNRVDNELQDMLETFKGRASVFVPFSVRGQWRGVLTVLFEQVREFSESEGRIFNALIDQAGVAIENRLLLRQTELTLGNIERLYAASRYINSAQNSVELLRAVMAASANPDTRLDFGLLEGALDDTGWPTILRMVAHTEQSVVKEADELQPIRIDLASPLRKREMAVMKSRDGLVTVFPLFSANQPIALLYLHTRTIQELTVEDAEIYRALAGQMSTVLENQRLLHQTSEALDESRRLYTASRAITFAEDSEAVFATASDHMRQSADNIEHITILLAGPKAGHDATYFETVYIWELQGVSSSHIQLGEHIPAPALPLGSAMAESNEPIYFNDLEADSTSDARLQTVFRKWGVGSVVAIPLRSQRRWFGAVICESMQKDAFDASYIRFARAVTDQVGVAVENRQLFEEARAEAQRALALAEVGQLANQIGAEFEQNISQVFNRVALSANYDRWLLALLDDDDRNHLEMVIVNNMPQYEDEPGHYFDLASAEHSLVDAVRTNRLLVINDPSNYPAFKSGQVALDSIGKHIVVPVEAAGRVAGALLVGRGLEQPDIEARDEQLMRTLAAQIAVALENRQLFRTIEQEREYLRSVLETMPTGIILLDPHTLIPIQANVQAETLLGKPINYSLAFGVEYYNLIRTGTDLHYPLEEMPIYLAAASGESAFSDDVAVVHDDAGQTDLLFNAAPIRDSRGGVIAIVVAFQNISNLRGLENTLQNSLREQIALYEATRALSEAGDVEEALDAAVIQLGMLELMDGYIVTLDENTGHLQVLRGMLSPEQFNLPESIFQADGLFISDVNEEAGLGDEVRDALLAGGIQALATVPMRARDILQGWIIALYDHVLSPGNDNERYLTTLADNAAVAIDNRNLQRRTESAFQEANILYETSRALANINSPEDIVNVLVSKNIMPEVNQVFMAVPTTSRTGIEMTVVANWQKDDSNINLLGVTLNEEQFPAWRLVSTESLITIDNVSIDTTLSDMERLGMESTDTRSLAVLPLRSNQRRLGVLWLSSAKPYHHMERDIRIYQSFAEQASLSLEATRLLEQTERRARQLSISAEVSQIANSILDVNTLLPQLVDLIRDAFNFDHAQVFLMDENDEFAVLRASTGEAGRQLLEINHKLARGSKSVIGQVTATGKPVIALDTADARVVHKPNPYLPLTRSELALPLIVKKKVVGALDVQSNLPNAFSDDEVQVLNSLANQISVAVENARLFEQSEIRARDMSFLFGATAAATDSDKSLQESLQSVAELVYESIEALNVSIYLAESYTDQYEVNYTLLRPTALVGSKQPLSELSEILAGNSDNFLGQMALDLTPRLIANLEEEPLYLPISTQARSVVAVPMVVGNQVVGIVSLESGRPNAYTLDTLNLLGTLTNSLSAIIQNNRLLEQVQRSNEQLRELDRLKSDFLANMSHELRTPLNSIIGFSRVILKGIDGPLTEMQEQDLNTIYNSGTHLLGLINDVLDQAKINSGKMDVHSEYFEMKSVVEGVRSIGIGLIKDKPVDMKLEVASGLPKAYGDEFRTRQVLLNLVSNASKFTQQGSITIQVYIHKEVDSGREMMRVDVRDTGIGIAEKDIPLLFEAFRQVDSSLTRTVGGTGLGLPIAKNLIEMQGGQMLVHSVVNEGSVFSVLLPLEPTEEALSDKPQSSVEDKLATNVYQVTTSDTSILPAANGGSAEPYTGEITERKRPAGLGKPKPSMTTMTMNVMPPNRHILLIEDNPDMVDQFRRALQRQSFDIFAASIPLEAEAMASGLRPMLIIMNTDFANGAGWDILGRLQNRDDTRDIPVIVVALDDIAARVQQAGAFAFVQRPFTPEQLLDVVQKAQTISQTERILIIDDQPESSRMLQQTLTESGQYHIFTANSGHEGMSLIARRRPNLVILDLRMPERDGFAVLEELRSNPETASIPVMIVTADTLNKEEQGRLGDLTVIYKTDLTQDNYQTFIDGVKAHLTQ